MGKNCKHGNVNYKELVKQHVKIEKFTCHYLCFTNEETKLLNFKQFTTQWDFAKLAAEPREPDYRPVYLFSEL
jgi:hypothetical protein